MGVPPSFEEIIIIVNMHGRWAAALVTFASIFLAGCGASPRPRAAAPDLASGWRGKLREAIPLYGHRNWIVVADSAYPAQSRPGIETIVSGEDHLTVLREVLAAVAASRHLRPVVLTDKELASVADADAPGIAAYRRELDHVLAGGGRSVLEHEQIISRLDQAAQTFRVLIIKTNLTLPYTSVFLQLDCGYWGADAEQRLRRAIGAGGSRSSPPPAGGIR
jgi:hypothetical protein